jgi:hypothetical protein
MLLHPDDTVLLKATAIHYFCQEIIDVTRKMRNFSTTSGAHW